MCVHMHTQLNMHGGVLARRCSCMEVAVQIHTYIAMFHRNRTMTYNT